MIDNTVEVIRRREELRCREQDLGIAREMLTYAAGLSEGDLRSQYEEVAQDMLRMAKHEGMKRSDMYYKVLAKL